MEILQVIDANVPLQRPPLKPPWSNSLLRRLKCRRRSALRKYSRNKSQQLKARFVLASKYYIRYNRTLYERYTTRMQRNLRLHPKRFWSFVRAKRKEDGLPASMYFGDRSTSIASSKCELFADHFKNAFSNTRTTQQQIDAAVSNTPLDSLELGIFQVTEEHVQSAICKLKESVSPGPDGIPSVILKKCSCLVKPLAKLFNLSFQRKTFPAGWKTSFLSPIHKRGDKCNVANYRGITSLSACSKLFEIIINNVLFEISKSYISSSQHGFYPKRSVATNLTQFTSLCIRSMDAGSMPYIPTSKPHLIE